MPSIRALESKANVDSGVSGRCTCWSVYMTPDSCTHVVLSTVPEGLEVSAVQRRLAELQRKVWKVFSLSGHDSDSSQIWHRAEISKERWIILSRSSELLHCTHAYVVTTGGETELIYSEWRRRRRRSHALLNFIVAFLEQTFIFSVGSAGYMTLKSLYVTVSGESNHISVCVYVRCSNKAGHWL